jgi:DNA-binding XRE family transcriptional regulator
MKTNNLKFKTFDQVFTKSLKKESFRKAYAEEMAYIKLAKQVREMRVAKKMTQKDLAEKADMSQSVIARIESGLHSFSLGTLQRLADVFDKEIQFA